jgi:hypothetical protein
MSNRARHNDKVCIIAGAGHSGSTVLGMVLGSHPACFYAGEAGKTRYLHDPRKDERKRVCKMCGEGCPIWGSFRLPEGVDLYEQISRITGRPVVVDSTKGLEWIDQRLAELEGTGSTAVLLFLQRDGRAVINSRVRKYPDRDPREQIQRWAEQIRATRALFDRFDGPKAVVRYEQFATDPAGVTEELCGLLGIGFVPRMLEFYRSEHHPLGGNNGAQYLVARLHGARPDRPYAKLSPRNREYYEHHDAGIRLDTRWRREMPRRVLELFEEIAGSDNEELRWEGP